MFSDKFAYISSILVNQFRAREKHQLRREECWGHFLIAGRYKMQRSAAFFPTGLPTYLLVAEQLKLCQKGIVGNASQDITAVCVASMLVYTLSPSAWLKYISRLLCLPHLFRSTLQTVFNVKILSGVYAHLSH